MSSKYDLLYLTISSLICLVCLYASHLTSLCCVFSYCLCATRQKFVCGRRKIWLSLCCAVLFLCCFAVLFLLGVCFLTVCVKSGKIWEKEVLTIYLLCCVVHFFFCRMFVCVTREYWLFLLCQVVFFCTFPCTHFCHPCLLFGVCMKFISVCCVAYVCETERGEYWLCFVVCFFVVVMCSFAHCVFSYS